MSAIEKAFLLDLADSWTCYINHDDEVLFSNPVICQLIGKPLSEIVGSSFYSLLFEPVRESIRLIFNKIRTGEIGLRHHLFSLLTNQESKVTLVAECKLFPQGIALKGKPFSTALEKSRYHLFLVTDFEGKIIDGFEEGALNILGYSREELIEKGHETLVFREDRPLFQEILQGRKSIAVIRMIKKDGKIIYIQSEATPTQGSILFLHTLYLREYLQTFDVGEDPLIHLMSERIKTPSQFIQESLENLLVLVKQRDLQPAALREPLIAMQREAALLQRIVEDFILLQKLRVGEGEFTEPFVFELFPALRDILNYLREAVVKEGIEFHSKLYDTGHIVKADPRILFGRILNQLIIDQIQIIKQLEGRKEISVLIDLISEDVEKAILKVTVSYSTLELFLEPEPSFMVSKAIIDLYNGEMEIEPGVVWYQIPLKLSSDSNGMRAFFPEIGAVVIR